MFKGRHFDQSVILLCVRWYLAYGLRLRDLREMMAERASVLTISTIHRWVVHFSPLMLKRFNRRKRAVTGKWHMDETYIKVRGQWMYLYRAIDSVGGTVEFHFSEHRDLPAAKRFLRKALEQNGRNLSQMGAAVSDVDLPASFEDLFSAHRWISSFEFTKNFTFEIEMYLDRISPALKNGRIADGLACSHETYELALELASQCRAAFGAMMSDYDAVLTIAASGEAPQGTATGDFAFCALWTALQVPCVTIPAFKGPNGMPVGLQLVGKKAGDTDLLKTASWVARALGLNA